MPRGIPSLCGRAALSVLDRCQSVLWLYVRIRRALFLWDKPRFSVAIHRGPDRAAIAGWRHPDGLPQYARRLDRARRAAVPEQQGCVARRACTTRPQRHFPRPDPTSVRRGLLPCATSGEQQKLVGYRVNALWKSTQGNYLAAGAHHNGTPARQSVNRSVPAAPATPAPPWQPLRPCPSAQGQRAPAPGPRSRP